MILEFIGICVCVIVLSVTIIICELMWEVHKEIRKNDKDNGMGLYYSEHFNRRNNYE